MQQTPLLACDQASKTALRIDLYNKLHDGVKASRESLVGLASVVAVD